MTKRTADDACISPSTGFRTKAACFTVPQWVLLQENGMTATMTSPPPVRRQSLLRDDADIKDDRFVEADIEMGSPAPLSPVQRQISSQKFWKSLCSPEGTALKNEPMHETWTQAPEPTHPLCPPKVVPKEQFDAVQGEVSSLKQTIAWLTRELNESRTRVAQLEAQCSPQNMLDPRMNSSGTALATSFHQQQQPFYFNPHQYIPVPLERQ